MLSHIAHTIMTLSLMLTAHASIPGWTPAAQAASTDRKCTMKSHRHTKVVTKKATLRGAGIVEQRRSPDIQILSFGP